MSHKIQVRFRHRHLSGLSGIKGEMALPVAYWQKCIQYFFFLIWTNAAEPTCKLRQRYITVCPHWHANTTWLIYQTTLSIICPPESSLHFCHRWRRSGRSWRVQKRKSVSFKTTAANSALTIHLTSNTYWQKYDYNINIWLFLFVTLPLIWAIQQINSFMY